MVHLHCELPTRLRDQTRILGNRRAKRMEWMPALMHKLIRLMRLPRMLDHRFSSPTEPVLCKLHCIPEACPCVAVDDLPRVQPKKATGPVKRMRSDGTGDTDTAVERARFKVSAFEAKYPELLARLKMKNAVELGRRNRRLKNTDNDLEMIRE